MSIFCRWPTWTAWNADALALPSRAWISIATGIVRQGPELAPENHALETWLGELTAQGLQPQLALDLHNDNSGKLHISRPQSDSAPYVARMLRLEQLLHAHTWFSLGVQFSRVGQPWTMGEGLLEQYGIDACILELNCDWIAGLQKVPFGADWELLGRQMREVFYAYFEP